MRKNLFNDFLDGKSLGTGRGQERQAAHLVVEFFAAGTGALQDNHHHSDSQSDSQKMVKRGAQQEQRTVQPERTVQAMQSTE